MTRDGEEIGTAIPGPIVAAKCTPRSFPTRRGIASGFSQVPLYDRLVASQIGDCKTSKSANAMKVTGWCVKYESGLAARAVIAASEDTQPGQSASFLANIMTGGPVFWVFNGDVGQVVRIDPDERELAIRFEEREVLYDFNELDEVSLAYAITIHKSQGSEFPAVVVPLALQHYLLLQRNLVCTAMTRGRRLVVLVGQRKALAIAIRNDRAAERFSGLYDRLVASQIV